MSSSVVRPNSFNVLAKRIEHANLNDLLSNFA